MQIATRTERIEPFYVMEIVKEAARLQAAGRSIIHMSIGEPDFTAPPQVQAAAIEAVRAGKTQYTPALGLDALRDAIAKHYQAAYGTLVQSERIVVTAGASAALLLAFATLVERDHEVLMPDPCYPCNRHFLAAVEAQAKLVACGPETRFQLTPEAVQTHWGERTQGVLLASPSNPTGTSIEPDVLRRLIDVVHQRQGFVIVDEIYQGLSYGHPPMTALSLSDQVLVLNSFSKYFNMTGWRLGWLVVPQALVSTVEKLAQNLFICPSAIAQHAALACFEPDAITLYEQRRAEFARRRDFLVPALQRLGLEVPVVPDGAFYIYVDVSRFSSDSWQFAFDLLRQTGVCTVPGRDFGYAAPQRYLRLSYATSYEKLEEAVQRIAQFLQR